MSKYTIELRKVCDIYTRKEVENWFKDYNLLDYLTQEEIDIINQRGTWNKDKLAKKIINHFFMHEIGLETPALFKHYAKITMEEIMESKLPLIYSASIKYDPMVNVDFTEKFERDIEGSSENQDNSSSSSETLGNSSNNSSNNSSGLVVNSDTPQGQINKSEILNGKYASSTQANENSSSIEDTTLNSTNTSSSVNSNSSRFF